MSPKNIIVFASGNGSNAQNIDRYFRENHQYGISHLVSDKPKSGALLWAETQKIPTTYIREPKNIDCSREFIRQADIIILAGYLKKIPSSLIECIQVPILNIHPSLLPKYGGQGMYGDRVHQAVLENGEKKSGISIHRVSENYDEGDIVLQSEVRIDENETIESLRNKIQTEEYEHLPKLIESLLYPTG